MADQDRLRADAEDAEVFSEMARTRLEFALASRDALVRRQKIAEQRRVAQRSRSDQVVGRRGPRQKGPNPQRRAWPPGVSGRP